MVSNRCKLAVRQKLIDLGFHFSIVNLGEVDIMENITPEMRALLSTEFNSIGFELIDDKRTILVEQIKNIIIESIDNREELIKINFSNYLSEKLNYDYAYLTNLFSEIQGTTIEQFLISHKIEKVKELITYGELSISDISRHLNYSSVPHLSAQFKKVVGISPSQFLKIKNLRRKPLEELGKSAKSASLKRSSKIINKNKLKLFLVEDNPVFLRMLALQFLEHDNFEVETYTTGELCVKNLVHNPDIIILDYHLNSIVENAMTGIETMDKINSLNANFPIIMLSSQDEIEVAVNCLRHKAVDYVVKNETAFPRLQKIITDIISNQKMEKKLNWFKDRM
jgi:AraC-like DNA-binding protein/ActR/RegA family two-component response regulator